MTQRLDYGKVAPDGLKAMLGLEAYARNSGLEHSLLELVKTRVSQINGCAFCLDMHTKDARAAACTCWAPGARRAACTPRASAPRWAGPRP